LEKHILGVDVLGEAEVASAHLLDNVDFLPRNEKGGKVG
jgi:hypothetical protein